MRLFSDPVAIFRADLVESAYTKRRQWEKPALVWAGLASVQPDRAFEDRSPARETAQERLIIYLPMSADVDSVDRITYDGKDYEVDGDPAEWAHGSLRHIRVRAWRVDH
ncbi:hypothetical protein FGW37_05365 [Streptomyces rectiverticillatus]|uniref:hypothetical protein n=1 Tax=Streptomyces rectiverticillatus TaxID=173860 RepID=UPI0015C3C404|nr:hypothetical protein [Streptomyces rectiverticillatus]QLE71107.1 hypothetical protein FGW37_05365 [Streptomyces rectiverticillatus]